MATSEQSQPLISPFAGSQAIPDLESFEPRDVQEVDEHEHYSDRAPWLRAAVLGANDGLVTCTSLILGVSGGTTSRSTLILSGLSSVVAGSLSMAVGEYISVSSQRDSEQADVDKEHQMQEAGPASRQYELEELAGIYVKRGLDNDLAMQVAIQLTKKDAVRAHARDELGIDVDELSNPWQAAGASAVCFTIGGGIPLMPAAFILDPTWRLLAVIGASTLALILFGAVGAWLGGAHKVRAALRVLIGGWLAFGITWYVGRLFGEDASR